MKEDKRSVLRCFAILTSIILLTQIIPIAGASDNDSRKNLNDVTKKIQAELDSVKDELRKANKAWKDAKNDTETAEKNYKQNPTDTNKTALEQAKKDEAVARENYQKALKNVRNFKAKLDDAKDDLKKASKVEKNTKKAENKDRKQAKNSTKKILADSEKLRDVLRNTSKAWKDAKNDTETAEKNYKQNPTDTNKTALEQAKKDEAVARENYQKALKNSKNFKAKLDPVVIEKSTKTKEEPKQDKDNIRKKSHELTKKIKVELEKARDVLRTANSALKDAKDASETAEQVFKQNPTDANKTALEQAKKDEANALFFYHKAILGVKNFKAKLDDIK